MSFEFDESNRYIVSVNISKEKGTSKSPLDKVQVNEYGIAGDAHAGQWHRQVSLLAKEDVDKFSSLNANGRQFLPGEFAENLTTSGIDFTKTAILDRLKIGEVELEVSQIGKTCHGSGCAIFVEVGKCAMPKAGIFTRVIKGGTISCGDKIEYFPRPLKIKIITLSDRASKGEYDDLSGPKIEEILRGFFSDKRWHTEFSYSLIPDNAADLMNELSRSTQDGIDFIFTTGGTGIGPRDITPDVVAKFADKTIPGIMESIRLKFGETIPSALLSRSVTAVKDMTIIYCLPGSVKAVSEYTNEILKTMEHSILMLHGLGH
jgi:molybdenum cofactor synthesis domain-containing protein